MLSSKSSNLKMKNLIFVLQLILYKEIEPNKLELLEDLNQSLEQASVFEDLKNGDIIVFQKELEVDHEYRLPTCKDFFRELYYKVD
jgi:ubiquitin carboxyl-terminal hydrolase 7